MPQETSNALATGTDIIAEQTAHASHGEVNSAKTDAAHVLRWLLGSLKTLNLTGKVEFKIEAAATGFGRYADVYIGSLNFKGRAQNLSTTKVAIKRLRFHIEGDYNFARSLAKEISIWSGLRHPNVLHFLGYLLEGEDLPMLVSEWMDNGTASSYVRKHPHCDLANMILGIAKGLAYLHGKGVIHADMKANNVLVSADGQPQICDFGISSILATSISFGSTSSNDGMKGSLRWMAAEFFQIYDTRHLEKTDVWAFGMTIYELLAKQIPFFELKLDCVVMYAIIRDEKPSRPDFLVHPEHDLQEELWNICCSCWERDPQLRPDMASIIHSLVSVQHPGSNLNSDEEQPFHSLPTQMANLGLHASIHRTQPRLVSESDLDVISSIAQNSDALSDCSIQLISSSRTITSHFDSASQGSVISELAEGQAALTTQSYTDFEVERNDKQSLKSPIYSRTLSRAPLVKSNSDYSDQHVIQNNVTSLLAAKARPFSISGHIPLEPGALTIFFRSASGITHSLDFPIDVEAEAPPALDVLIAVCKPHVTYEMDGFSDRQPLFYPPNLPLTASLELANHPIMDAIRTALFPRLSQGQYIFARREVVELVPTGGHMCPQRHSPKDEGKVATIIVTLPIRFKGGALVVHDFDGNNEKYYGRGGKPGDLEWTAFLADCEHEIETVSRGVRLTISYSVLLGTFGPSPSPSQSPMLPSDRYLDLISPILNASRGQTVAFYLREQYGFSPADVLAESLVPHLKGGDALLYHSLHLYKLVPELRWAAGGYVWPVDATVDTHSLLTRTSSHDSSRHSMSPPMSPTSRQRRPGALRGGFSLTPTHDPQSDSDDDEYADRESAVLRSRVEKSGAIPLIQAGIKVLTDEVIDGESITKERVPYIAEGTLQKLIVNCLLVVNVP